MFQTTISLKQWTSGYNFKRMKKTFRFIGSYYNMNMWIIPAGQTLSFDEKKFEAFNNRAWRTFKNFSQSVSEFYVVKIHDREKRLFELVDGVLVEKPMGFQEGFFSLWIGTILNNFLANKGLGIVFGADSMMQIHPKQVRMPDVSFFNWERLILAVAMHKGTLTSRSL